MVFFIKIIEKLLIFWVHIPESIFKINKRICKIKYQKLKVKGVIATSVQSKLIDIGTSM